MQHLTVCVPLPAAKVPDWIAAIRHASFQTPHKAVPVRPQKLLEYKNPNPDFESALHSPPKFQLALCISIGKIKFQPQPCHIPEIKYMIVFEESLPQIAHVFDTVSAALYTRALTALSFHLNDRINRQKESAIEFSHR